MVDELIGWANLLWPLIFVIPVSLYLTRRER